MRIGHLSMIISVLIYGCNLFVSDSADQGADDGLKKSQSLENESASKGYTPPVGYQSNGVDPLAALYGGSKGKTQTADQSAQSLEVRFNRLSKASLRPPFPKKWRRAFEQLAQIVPLKITEWSSTTRTRMERGKRDKALKVKFVLFGQKSEVSQTPYKILKKASELKGFPQKLGDEHEHISKTKTQELRVSYDASISHTESNPMVLAEVTIHWSLQTPNIVVEKPKNCRYVHALEQRLSEGYVSWASQHFKSTSSRRFVEWHVEYTVKKRIWRATWIYRNGSYRDKAVGWWSDKLSRQKATQASEQGLEQVWRRKEGEEVQWWPETDPGPMGCQIAGPLLTIEGTSDLK